MGSAFIPRSTFPTLASIPRSYFLGHHRAGLDKMKAMLSSIDLVIECRDYRVPLTSRNPMFEESLAGRHRLVVYTKKDLGSNGRPEDRRREEVIRKWHGSSPVLFSDHLNRADVKKILRYARDYGSSLSSLVSTRVLVVGMPNVGKSSLLNALRHVGVSKGKAAQTGAQPGVTRKIGTGVKIVEGRDGEAGVYLLDTPGVFMPYVADPESMLKLALCGSVKDTIVPPTTLADYLLFQLNQHDPVAYAQYHPPTNDISLFLATMARQTGRLQKGGIPDLEGTALWMMQRWRGGHLGRFVLDSISEQAYEQRAQEHQDLGGSLNQAKKAERADRQERSRQRRLRDG